ncbi:hypothetical protein V8F33_003394 [Rhypophila sp. PSN 637]
MGMTDCLDPSAQIGVGRVLSRGLATMQPSGTPKQLVPLPGEKPMQKVLPGKTISSARGWHLSCRRKAPASSVVVTGAEPATGGVGRGEGTGIKVCLEPSSHTGVGMVLSFGLTTKQPSGTMKQLSLPPRESPMQIWSPAETTSSGLLWIHCVSSDYGSCRRWNTIAEGRPVIPGLGLTGMDDVGRSLGNGTKSGSKGKRGKNMHDCGLKF